MQDAILLLDLIMHKLIYSLIKQDARHWFGGLNLERTAGMAEADVTIDYTNWRGERSTRRIRPSGTIRFAATEWHPEPQWLIFAHDLEKGADREFAAADIHSWKKG